MGPLVFVLLSFSSGSGPQGVGVHRVLVLDLGVHRVLVLDLRVSGSTEFWFWTSGSTEFWFCVHMFSINDLNLHEASLASASFVRPTPRLCSSGPMRSQSFGSR
ncbi:hypothetical protein EYF80_057867 [Liparis tanakae]|uniref:Secreted protein n=1 Tax=Liparis tanakae TaxID=230148 RepID=A0A4Z2EUB9_9TELE|nr:hypothetical protein EYF80_057867 [Liparis tanakae]